MSALFSVSLSTCLYHVHRIFLVVFTNPDDVNLHSKGQQQYSIKHFSISQVSHPCGWHGHIVFQLQRKRKPKRQTSKLRCKVGDAQKVMVGFGKEKWSLFDLENLRADTFLGEQKRPTIMHQVSWCMMILKDEVGNLFCKTVSKKTWNVKENFAVEPHHAWTKATTTADVSPGSSPCGSPRSYQYPAVRFFDMRARTTYCDTMSSSIR